jgi:hypothetical protein
MKMRSLVSTFAAGAVLLMTGAAFSGSTSTNDAQLVSFDRTTSTLWALPTGLPLASYLNQPVTTYVAADLASFEPPDPCIPLVRAWNFTVDFDKHTGRTSTFVFEVLLDAMSDLSCHATVTSNPVTSPQPLIVITPIPG